MSKLYLVPTPIGNLKDMTFRAVEVLKSVTLILSEDTRVSKKLLNHYEIATPLTSHHKFNEHKTVNAIVERIKKGEQIALISDAGTPAISDPGFLLVRSCVENNIDIECLPGATALIPALVNSALPNDRFCFEGFLPIKKGRQKKMGELLHEKRTMVFYESPHRLVKTLQLFAEHWGGERKASVSRELSKMFEENARGTLTQLIEHFSSKEVKGEIVIVVEGDNKKEIADTEE